ncbi:hypothetical protein Patl1_03909 [Pistacia atlantica]|uniref:Uncharacterized protein n=1 Tax=Pistacia atlantica TaxID=434234 RepID=A0ACC1BTE0_9ROSI|nr:hypothetical protein Patl1_03909 [Pistacia atlantica]
MSSFTSSTAKRISQIPHKFPKFKPFSHNKPQTKPLNNGHHHELRASQMENSIYNLLTIDRWESLNHMDYKLASLRPVHGKLALKFLNWVMKNTGLELTHLTHLLCLTAHVLVKARMYDDAKVIFRQLAQMGIGQNSVFGTLINTYPLCNSNPSVFDLLIRVYMREGMVVEGLETFRLMGFRGFNPSIFTCNMMLGCLQKECGVGSVWLVFREMLARKICPNVATFNVLLNVLCVEGNLKKADYLVRKMEESG